MPGRHVTDCQMGLYMTFRRTKPVLTAGAKAGFSTATAYRIEGDPRIPLPRTTPRGRPLPDPLAALWESEVVPLLQSAPGLRPIAVFEEVRRRHPELGAGVRRTPERRIRAWRALHGPEQEVIFRQIHHPGRLGLSNFTDMRDLAVTIAGPPLDYRSTTSGWSIRDSSTPMSSSAARAISPSPRGCRTRSGRWAPRR